MKPHGALFNQITGFKEMNSTFDVPEYAHFETISDLDPSITSLISLFSSEDVTTDKEILIKIFFMHLHLLDQFTNFNEVAKQAQNTNEKIDLDSWNNFYFFKLLWNHIVESYKNTSIDSQQFDEKYEFFKWIEFVKIRENPYFKHLLNYPELQLIKKGTKLFCKAIYYHF